MNSPHSIGKNSVQDKDLYSIEPFDLNTASIPEEWLICPYTRNISDVYAFLNTNFNTSYSDLLYYRKGNEDGTSIFDETVYSLDNLLYYKTLAQQEQDYGWIDIYTFYTELLDTNLISSWGDGFVGSINGTSGKVIDGNRYLLDNLMPIFMLLENYNSYFDSYISDISSLLTSEFWDSDDSGYYHSNSSTSANKEAIDNLNAVMANLLLYNTLGDTTTYLRANQTMEALMENMWDDVNLGFDVAKGDDWSDVGQNLKRLDVNALGIMTLVDYWMVTNITSYLDNATLLYDKINTQLWYSNEDAYYLTSSAPSWTTPSSDAQRVISSEANSLMMQACLKLFEATGNMLYYDKAFELFQSFESNFYDSTNNAYAYISYPGTYQSNNKNMTSNLRVLESYLKASEIYNSFEVVASFNDQEALPSFIFNQDAMNVTVRLSYQAFENISYFSNIPINYSIRTSNEVGYGWTKIDETSGITGGTYKSHNLSYDITSDTMPVKDNYSILIWSYSEKYNYDETILYFNVVSGLEDGPIINLEEVLYQGPTINVTIPINNTRNKDVTLNVSMEGANIDNQTLLNIEFESNNMTYVSFNLTTKFDAVLGDDEIVFRFTNGSVIFLDILVPITIGDSFKHSPIIYMSEVVSGDLLDISFNLINYLPSDSQTINVSFSGSAIDTLLQPVTLLPSESKALIFQLTVTGSGMEYIVLTFSKTGSIYYTETLEINIVPLIDLISVSVPGSTPQWEYSRMIMKINYNGNDPEQFSLKIVEENAPIFASPHSARKSGVLTRGENRIEASILTTYNPYEFGVKSYRYELRDGSGVLIASGYFEVTIELSMSALFLCYILPISIPIALILIYKNKEMKNKQLRRSK